MIWSPTIDTAALDGETLNHLLPTLVNLNIDYLRAVGPDNVPPLYETRVRYIPDLFGRERWATIPHVYRRGCADCKSLCAWRVAELNVRGNNAKCGWIETGPQQYHIVVCHEDGSIEDPSLELGMGWKEGFR